MFKKNRQKADKILLFDRTTSLHQLRRNLGRQQTQRYPPTWMDAAAHEVQVTELPRELGVAQEGCEAIVGTITLQSALRTRRATFDQAWVQDVLSLDQ